MWTVRKCIDLPNECVIMTVIQWHTLSPVKLKILTNKSCVHSVKWRIGSDKNFEIKLLGKLTINMNYNMNM